MCRSIRNPLDEVLAHSESMVTSRRETKSSYIYEYRYRDSALKVAFENSGLSCTTVANSVQHISHKFAVTHVYVIQNQDTTAA